MEQSEVTVCSDCPHYKKCEYKLKITMRRVSLGAKLAEKVRQEKKLTIKEVYAILIDEELEKKYFYYGGIRKDISKTDTAKKAIKLSSNYDKKDDIDSCSERYFLFEGLLSRLDSETSQS